MEEDKTKNLETGANENEETTQDKAPVAPDCPFDPDPPKKPEEKAENSQKDNDKVEKEKKKKKRIIYKELEAEAVKLQKDASELVIITKAKDFVKYVMDATIKSPKKFRFTLVSKMQDNAMQIIEDLYRANDIVLKPDDARAMARRYEYQSRAMTTIKIVAYLAQLASEVECILPKQFIQISKQGAVCMYLLNSWIASDKRRMLN